MIILNPSCIHSWANRSLGESLGLVQECFGIVDRQNDGHFGRHGATMGIAVGIDGNDALAELVFKSTIFCGYKQCRLPMTKINHKKNTGNCYELLQSIKLRNLRAFILRVRTWRCDSCDVWSQNEPMMEWETHDSHPILWSLETNFSAEISQQRRSQLEPGRTASWSGSGQWQWNIPEGKKKCEYL